MQYCLFVEVAGVAAVLGMDDSAARSGKLYEAAFGHLFLSFFILVVVIDGELTDAAADSAGAGRCPVLFSGFKI